jgi:phage tail-like protein
MSAVKRTTEVVEWREAGGPSITRRMPARSKYEPVTLEAGLTHDRQFLEWAEQVHNPQGDAAMSLVNYRKEVTIEVLNLQGVPVMAFKLHRAWVSEFQALPEMDANANAVAIQTLKLEYEGFSIDEAVAEPAES